MPMEKILVLEDDALVRKSLEQLLRHRRYDVAGVATISAAQECLAQDNFDLVLCDVRLPDGDGTEFLRQLQSRPGKPLVVMMTGFGSVESAVACMKAGAFDYLLKPFSGEQLEVTLQKAQEFTRLLKVNRFFSRADVADEPELLGQSPALAQVRELIRKVARTQATVLIHGESGTGKELVARAIHQASPRAQGPFIRVNCAAIPESLIESEFFGHEKGAFTGALTRREGRFELAHGGTLLLDEISEIPLPLQAKLLRVLQERELERVGGSRTIKVDVRVLATTNRDLEQSIEKQEFRQDLYFRLNVVPVAMPPLRERREDILFLAEQFRQRFERKHGVRTAGLSAASRVALENHAWPGNVRELQTVLERAVILCTDGEPIQPAALGFHRPPPGISATQLPLSSTTGTALGAAAPLTLSEVEKRHILETLDQCGANRTHAARKLGISIRTLRNKLNEYELGDQASAGAGDAATAGVVS